VSRYGVHLDSRITLIFFGRMVSLSPDCPNDELCPLLVSPLLGCLSGHSLRELWSHDITAGLEYKVLWMIQRTSEQLPG
jgi:hypothetical protein